MRTVPPPPKAPRFTNALQSIMSIEYKSQTWDGCGNATAPERRSVIEGGYHDGILTKHRAQAILDALDRGEIRGYGRVK